MTGATGEGAAAPGHAFIVGCSRSGTTALMTLINASEHAAIGNERFKYRRQEITPADFSRQRFFDFRAEDTNILPGNGSGWKELYTTLEHRWDAGTVTITGDKVGRAPHVATHLEASFGQPRFVFIYRDIMGVASSYTARASNPDDKRWPEDRRHEAAVVNWHVAFETGALLLAMATDRVFPVRYETLFSGDLACARALYAFLELPWTPEVAEAYAGLTADWPTVSAKPLTLDPGAEDHIREHARLHVADQFDELAALAIRRWCPGGP